MTQAQVALMAPAPETWVALAVISAVGEARQSEFLDEALAFHRRVSGDASAHLALTSHNTFRTPWLAASLLLCDPQRARDGAKALLELVASIAPDKRTAFEEHLFEDEGLWKALEDFSNADPPTLLWRGQLKYEALFRFLAPRFLLAPDDVLDAERVHARWQWMCQEKRNQTMQSFNAELRLRHYLEHNQAPPEPNELLEHLEAEQADQQLRRRGLDEAGEVALGLRASWIYRRRLNLSLAEHQLVDAPHDPVASVGKDFTRAWRNYLRLVFEAGHVFTVSLCPSSFLYIAANKIVAGKERRPEDAEPVGRKLAIVFFERAPDDPATLRRVHRETLSMRQDLLTLAELLQTLGFFLPADPDRSASQTEEHLEAHYQNLHITKWGFVHAPGHPSDPLALSLGEHEDAEEALVLQRAHDQRTKMSLARLVQQLGLLGPTETLEQAWKASKEALGERVRHALPADPPGKGRGRGRGRRGRGRA